MGNCWSKCQCYGGGSGNAHGSDPNVVHHSVGAAVHASGNDNGSNPSTSQPQPANPPQAFTGNESSTLAFTVKDIAELEEISNYIQDVIVKHKKKLDPKVIPQKMLSSNLNQADHLLNRISREFDRKGRIVSIAAEAQMIVPNVLKELGDADWMSAGISMIALVLERVDQMGENKEKCLTILEDLGNLSSVLVKLLRQELPNSNDNLRKGIYLICEGVIWCDKYLQSGHTKRFAFVNINEDSIEDLTSRIERHYKYLTLDVGVQIFEEAKAMRRQMTMPLGSFNPRYPEGTVGLGEKVSEVLHRLGVTKETIEPGVRAILLHGMGGIGKTTLAEAICAEIPITKFVSQVEVGENPTNDLICNLQRDICERMFGIKQRIGSYEEGQDMLQKHLSECKSPILLFIDNVFKQEHLSKLLPRPLHLPDKSRLIITARDSRISEVLNEGIIACKSHLVQELNTSEAQELFDKVVGGCPPGKEQQVATILELCGGLPLALEVVGKYLKGGDRKNKPREWDSTIAGIREFRTINGEAQEKLNDILRWSYEQLGEGPKQVFLDVSYLLRNAFWDWGECLGARSELERLKDFSLVKKVDRKQEEIYMDPIFNDEGYLFRDLQSSVIEVHDLLASLGRHISESASPRTRFSFNNTETFEKFFKANQQGCHAIEGLVVNCEYEEYVLPAGELDAMHQSLRILILRGLRIEDTCHEIPAQLQICCTRLYGNGTAFPYTNISPLSNLRVLDIEGDVAFDFRDVQFPESLEILQLENVGNLHAFRPDSFEKCSRLHSLFISDCRNLKELPPSFCRLGNLRTLRLQENIEVTTLPDFDGLQSLESVCILQSGKEFPNGISKLVKLRHLHVHGVRCLPNGLDLSRLSLLENLGFRDIQRITELPKGLGNLSALEKFVFDCSGLEKLSSDFGGLINLQVLQLYGCEYLEALPDSIVSLEHLRLLVVKNCSRMEKLPENFGKLIALETLELYGCEYLEALPDSIVSLKHLRKLVMKNCRRMEKLPENFGKLIALESLKLYGCDLLKELPRDLGNLISLQEMCLEDCGKLETLPDSISTLKKLKTLRLAKCMKLKKLPNNFGNLVPLEKISFNNCEALEALPDSVTSLKNLKELSIERCTRLEKLPNDFSSLQARTGVSLEGCTRLENLQSGPGRTGVSLEGCTRLENLQSGPGNVVEPEHTCDVEA